LHAADVCSAAPATCQVLSCCPPGH
jgi:hypothetical protein